MNDTKIEFPCDYPIRVIGDSGDEFSEEILVIARRHDNAASLLKQRPSSKGKYHSITLSFRATGEPQLKRLFDDLKEHPAVRMVL